MKQYRKSKANPCKKKGGDSHKKRLHFLCELVDYYPPPPKGEYQGGACRDLKYQDADSHGSLDYKNKNPEFQFNGCTELEQDLLDEGLLRYELREKLGLEVLFRGMERESDPHSNFYNFSLHSKRRLIDQKVMNLFSYDSTNKKPLLDYNDISQIQENISITGSDDSLFPFSFCTSAFANEIFALPPENLDEVVFDILYRHNEFDKKWDDVAAVAECIKRKIDLKEDIKKIWPQYTLKKYREGLVEIQKIIYEKTPLWAKKFSDAWKALTEKQQEAVILEFSPEWPEKLTQKEKAATLDDGISVWSYRDRLYWAYNTFEKHYYPEFERPRPKEKKPKESEYEKRMKDSTVIKYSNYQRAIANIEKIRQDRRKKKKIYER